MVVCPQEKLTDGDVIKKCIIGLWYIHNILYHVLALCLETLHSYGIQKGVVVHAGLPTKDEVLMTT